MLSGMLLAIPAEAQQSSWSRRFFVSAHLAEASWAPTVTTGDGVATRGERERGLGFGMGVGYGVTPRLSLYISGEGARLEPTGGGDRYTLAHGDLGMRYTVGGWAVRPYLDLAIGGRTAEIVTDAGRIDVRGGAFSFGCGLRYFISPSIALNGRVRRTISAFHAFEDDEVDLDVDVEDAPSTHIGLGIDWHPGW